MLFNQKERAEILEKVHTQRVSLRGVCLELKNALVRGIPLCESTRVHQLCEQPCEVRTIEVAGFARKLFFKKNLQSHQ